MATSSSSISDLPEHIIEYILLHLSPYGDLHHCKQVNRLWYRLATGAIVCLNRLFRRCHLLEWYQLQQVPDAKGYSPNIAERCSHAACYHASSGSMFVFGGCTAAYTTFNDLWRLDLATRCWTRCVTSGSFPTPKACATLVEYADLLFLFGGWSKSSPNPIHQTAMFFNELHVYNPVSNDWSEVSIDCAAPHLAGHSATMIDDRMVIFGGSMGSCSCNTIWVFNIRTRAWSQPTTSTIKPAPRYGQSQLRLDANRILVVGGCGGPNMMFADVWLLTIADRPSNPWIWQEVTISNPQLAAPLLWSHPACRVGDNLVVFSRPPRSTTTTSYRAMSSSVTGTTKGWLPPQGNLIPPRRKLLSSRSLDEQDETAPCCSQAVPKKVSELQRASSIPAIIVGEIPKLVVTSDDCELPESSASCIAMAASSLLPHQATARSRPPPSSGPGHRQLHLLQHRMDDYVRSRVRNHSTECANKASNSRPKSTAPGFRYCSPPPKSRQDRASAVPDIHTSLCSRNPMCMYMLDLTSVLADGIARWTVCEPNTDAPEDTILFSLVVARGELVMFGGMRSGNSAEGLDVTPFTHTITNETFLLRPPIKLY